MAEQKQSDSEKGKGKEGSAFDDHPPPLEDPETGLHFYEENGILHWKDVANKCVYCEKNGVLHVDDNDSD
jgi:hypothetical protein